LVLVRAIRDREVGGVFRQLTGREVVDRVDRRERPWLVNVPFLEGEPRAILTAGEAFQHFGDALFEDIVAQIYNRVVVSHKGPCTAACVDQPSGSP
jgi:hypothetical protein